MSNAAPRGQKPDRAGEAAGTEFYAMSEVDELPAAGVRPPSLGEPPGPAVKVGREQQPGKIEQPSLDAPVLQMVDPLIDVLGYFGTLVPDVAEQFIEVPRFLLRMGTCSAPRSWRRNWLSQPFLFSSSRSSTIRFRVVVFLDMEVFKIFFQNKVLLRLVEQIIVFPLQFVVRVVEVLKVYAQDRIQQRFAEQNADLPKLCAQDRIQQLFSEQKVDLFMVYAQKRVPRRFSEVQVLVEGLKTLSHCRVQVFVMMLGSWSRRWSSVLLAPAGWHDSLRVLSGYYVHVESQAETWMLPAFEG